MMDIYFEPHYGELYEKIEDGITTVFEHSSKYGKIHHMFIKREIETKIGEQTLYDLITPYGYGGPLILECEEGCRSLLVEEFGKEFQEYCIKNNIVSEFIRFHPIANNAEDFKGMYDVSHIRNTVGTNLADFDDPFQAEFSKSCRKNVRRALRDDVSYKITEKPRDISNFKEIYYSTMDRNEASEYYYFDEEYFNKCIELFPENVLLVEAVYEEQTIAMGLYFIYNGIIHIHLSGTLSEFLNLSPAYILRYAVTKWGKEKGYKLIHHGGGRSDDVKDGLYLFKKQFGKNTEFKFFIGKKIWNEEIYKELCNFKKVDKDTDYFPVYRNKFIG